jgi:hypothetical protein
VQPADADQRGALAFAQPADRLAQLAIEFVASAVVQRAVVQADAMAERPHRVGGNRRRQVLVLRPVAMRLRDQHRAVRGAEMPDIAEPVRQAPVAEDHALVRVFVFVLGLACPDQQEDRAGAQEQGVRAVIQVLAAEIPDVEASGLRVAGVERG